MKPRLSLRLILLTGLLVLVAPLQALAQAPPDTPLPLPDLILYGTVLRDGQPLSDGTVKALLPRGGVVTAVIAPVSGTDYGYVLSIPLRQYDVGDTAYDAGSVRLGENITFQINDAPAMFTDANGVVLNSFMVPGDGNGGAYHLDLFLSGPDAYSLGDVNASGRRDSGDALLVLKYDVGLIEGVTSFPPGPRTIYLPLCDIIEDGVCNASDALRILQCDVGMSGVECPNHPTAAAIQEQNTPNEALLLLHLQIEADAATEQVIVRVLADDPQAAFGAGTLELVYDLQQLTPVDCQETSADALDMASCNADYAPGVVRFNALSTTGLSDGTELATVSFHMNHPLGDDSRLQNLSLAIVDTSDHQGAGLPWQLAAPELIPIPGDSNPLYLPLLWSFQASQQSAPAPSDIPIPEESQRLYLPLLFHAQVIAAADVAPTAAQTPAPDLVPRLYLPELRR
ncbi:MAG: hypothetical protein GXP37_09835 [Chloroflexi bacterium]|nr:hypothetical protein [Chloroflexota bacterium]